MAPARGPRHLYGPMRQRLVPPGRCHPRTVADCLADPAHAGPVEGAARFGEAASDGRIVRIGIWPAGTALRARFRASTCASLIAYAEVACAAIEAGAPPDAGGGWG
jgi:hypothetical protein